MKWCEGSERLRLTPRFDWESISVCRRSSGSICKMITISELPRAAVSVRELSRARLPMTPNLPGQVRTPGRPSQKPGRMGTGPPRGGPFCFLLDDARCPPRRCASRPQTHPSKNERWGTRHCSTHRERDCDGILIDFKHNDLALHTGPSNMLRFPPSHFPSRLENVRRCAVKAEPLADRSRLTVNYTPITATNSFTA